MPNTKTKKMNDVENVSYIHLDKGKVKPDPKQSYISLEAPKSHKPQKKFGSELLGFLFLGLWFSLSRLNDNLFMEQVCICGVILCCLLMFRSAN